MRETRIAIETLRVFLTSTGFVALDAENMDADDLLAYFGPNGLTPPRSLVELVTDTLDMMSAAPDVTDAAHLRALADALSASLTKVERLIARLDDGEA